MRKAQNIPDPIYDDEVKETLASFTGWGSSGWSPPGKENIKKLYDALSEKLHASRFENHSVFLNLGYVPDDTLRYSRVALPELYLRKNNTNLVLELIGDCPLDPAARILDIGCGRGGTVSVFRQFFQVGAITGLDLSSKAIAFCRQRHQYPNTAFEVGDAENLPETDETFDVVTNVESSHNYANILLFYREVYRVLKPGGHFLYTDLMPVARVQEYRNFLTKLGFLIEQERDVSNNVLLSCREMAATHAQSLSENEAEKRLIGEFLLKAGSQSYDKLRIGDSRYMLFRLLKQV